jgi:hypothetical protein
MNQIVRESSLLWHDLKFDRPDAFDPRNKLRHSVQRLAFVRRHINVIRSVDVGSYIVSDSSLEHHNRLLFQRINVLIGGIW